MDHHGSGFATSPWAAVLGHHATIAATAAVAGAEHTAANFAVAAAAHAHHHSTHINHHHHHQHHPGMPMDLHMPQSFPYYRYREDALCWGDRKSIDDMTTPPSVNARILELRKEKSRDAARSRRGKENFEFYELAKMLPLPAAITSQLDKASIIRLTISYLKLRDFSGHGDPPWQREPTTSSKVLKSASIRRSPAVELFEQHQGTHILQSLDGFALAVAADGRFLYISETVSIYLGLSQVEMTGSSIFDYVHQQDHNEIAEQLGLSLTHNNNQQSGNNNNNNNNNVSNNLSSNNNSLIGIASPSSGGSADEGLGTSGTNNPDVSASMSLSAASAYKGYDRAFCVRMKSTLTKRGCHFKSSGYRVSEEIGNFNNKTSIINYSVVLFLCRLRPQYTFSHSRKSQPPLLGMVALAIALPPPSVHEIRLECDMFVTRIHFDFRIAHCEPKVQELLDYSADELVGKSLYNLCHGEDSEKLRKCHLDLINKGQVLTHYYRILNKNGGYTWLQTCATVVCSSKNADEQNIICVNYVVSHRENCNSIQDCIQLEGGFENIIKHEKITDITEISSASCDPSSEVNSESTVSKIEIDRSIRLQNNIAVPNIPNISDDKKVQMVPAPVKRGQKRKIKITEENQQHLIEQPKSSPAAISNSSEHCDTPRSRQSSLIDEHTESSVKDLENAMSKHLPSPLGGGSNSSTTDFNAEALLKQQQQQEKSSTIQWIGTPNPYHHHHHHLNHQQPATMPATALLRQLYANRESVIRATARQSQNGVYFSENQNNGNGCALPTPPGSESSFDNQFLHLHHGQKTSDAFSNLVSTYGSYHPHGNVIDYHNAMTPPSSVSPRDSGMKNNNANNNNNHAATANSYDYSTDNVRGHHSIANNPTDTGNSTPSLPLKPQPYSVAAMHHPTTSSIESSSYSGSIEQSQYFSPHSSFHLYHKGTPASATGAGWYSTPS